MGGDTAGDPGGALKWTRRTTAKLARQLRESGIRVGTRTVARLLRSMGYSLRDNHKKLAAANHPQRDAQFAHITVLRRRGASENIPIISIDTKKKELIGRFKRRRRQNGTAIPSKSTTTTSVPSLAAWPSPMASTTCAPIPAPSSSEPPATPPSSTPIESPHGGATTESSPIPTPAA